MSGINGRSGRLIQSEYAFNGIAIANRATGSESGCSII
jgi:hypothetical protein